MTLICETCKGTNFFTEEGSQICSECGTKLRSFLHIIDDNLSEKFVGQGTNQTSISYVSQKDGKGKKIIENEYEQWCSYEAFNIILKNWADALVDLGASEIFRSTLLKLWVRYLQIQGIAFVQPHDKDKLVLVKETEQVYTERDAMVLKRCKKKEKESKIKINKSVAEKFETTIQNKKLKGKHLSLNSLATFLSQQTHKDNVKKGKDADENEETTDHLKESLFSEEFRDQLLQSKQNEIKEERRESYKNKATKRGKSMIVLDSEFKNNQKIKNEMLMLTTSKLLSFIYLAILITKENILLMELLRWCRENAIPYVSARYLLPPCYKLNLYHDQLIFVLCCSRIPAACDVRDQTLDLAYLLSLQSVPIPPLANVTPKLVTDLNLPASLGKMVEDLLSECVCHFLRLTMPPVETRAFAELLVVMKICYGLDGLHEELLSDWAERLNCLLKKHGSSLRLFSYREWIRSLSRYEWWLRELSVPYHEKTMVESESINKRPLDAKRFNNYFWTSGIWRCSDNFKSEELIVPDILLHESLGLQDTNLQRELQRVPLLPSGRREMRMGYLKYYINTGHRHDEGHNAPLLLKVAKELETESFSDCMFDWPRKLSIVEKELRKHGCDIHLLSVSVNVGREEVTPSNLLPTPIRPDAKAKNYFTIPNPEYQCSNLVIEDDLPKPICRLLSSFSLYCETSEADLTKQFFLLLRLAITGSYRDDKVKEPKMKLEKKKK